MIVTAEAIYRGHLLMVRVAAAWAPLQKLAEADYFIALQQNNKLELSWFW